MNTVQHVLWEDAPHDDVVRGLLKIEIYFHGGGTNRLIIEGSHNEKTGETFLSGFYTPLDFGPGVSGVSVRAVGRIV